MLTEKILKEAEAMQDELVEIRRYLHNNAEIEFQLDKTVGYVKSKLVEFGCDFADCGNNGVVCNIGKNKGDGSILLRADMDALPVKEASGLDFACDNGNMHACGHDMHTAMLLGAAKLLKKYEAEMKCNVKLMFQPAEETLSGAKNMIDNGVLEKPCVKCAAMLHVMSGVPIKTGTFVVSSGGIGAPAADYFTINVQGKGCHGSTPQQGVDALTIAAHILIGLQEISARELGVSDEVLVTIGSLHGGTAGNVIADTATLQGTMRAYSDDLRERIRKRISDISESIGCAYRGKVCVSFGSGCPTLKNDSELSVMFENSLVELFGKEMVLNSDTIGQRSSRSGGSEDFAYISNQVPSVMIALAAGEPEKGFQYPLHHPKVMFDESVLYKGAAALTFIALNTL